MRKYKKYKNLRFETKRAEINNFRSPQSCTILLSKMFREMLISYNRIKKQKQKGAKKVRAKILTRMAISHLMS